MSDATEDIVLELRSLYVGYYKDLNILQDLNVKVRKNQITAILGANGVGKSTALKAVFGFLRPNEGQVLLEGEDIIDVPTHQRILKGLAYIPQQPGIFKDMSVEENLELGGWTFKRDKKQIAEFGLTDNQKKAANIEVEKITIAADPTKHPFLSNSLLMSAIF